MVSTPVELPDNLPACHAIILRQAEAIGQLEARIEQLNRDLASLKRQLFGCAENDSRPAAEKIGQVKAPPRRPPRGRAAWPRDSPWKAGRPRVSRSP